VLSTALAMVIFAARLSASGSFVPVPAARSAAAAVNERPPSTALTDASSSPA
jgi:hypothetical protein